MFPMFSILRSRKYVLAHSAFFSLTNKLANGFNIEFLTTIGADTGTSQLSDKISSTELDKEATTRSTKELIIEPTAEKIESSEFLGLPAIDFFSLVFSFGGLSCLFSSGLGTWRIVAELCQPLREVCCALIHMQAFN